MLPLIESFQAATSNYIVTKYSSFGDLSQYLTEERKRGRMSEKIIKQIIAQAI